MHSNIFDEVAEKAAEQGRQMASQAKKQITGSEAKAAAGSNQDNFRQILGDIKPMSGEQMLKAKTQEEAKKAHHLAAIRAGIKRINDELQAYRAKKAREMPANIAGKPGQGRTVEAQTKIMEDQKKQQEENKKKELPRSTRQNLGSHEQDKFAVG